MRKLEHMNGRLFDMETIPALRVRRESGWYDAPAALESELGNNYIYIGPEHKKLKLPGSPLAANGKTAKQYRSWLWAQIRSKNEAVLTELGKMAIATSIAHWPEDSCIAEVVIRAADWVQRYTKPEPEVPSDLDYSGRFGESELGWDGYAAKHEVRYSPYRRSLCTMTTMRRGKRSWRCPLQSM